MNVKQGNKRLKWRACSRARNANKRREHSVSGSTKGVMKREKDFMRVFVREYFD